MFFVGVYREGKDGGERVLLLLSKGQEVPDRDEDEPCNRIRLLESDREGQGDLQRQRLSRWDEENTCVL